MNVIFVPVQDKPDLLYVKVEGKTIGVIRDWSNLSLGDIRLPFSYTRINHMGSTDHETLSAAKGAAEAHAESLVLITKSEHFNQLTPAQAERIAIIMEEAAEVVQVCGKILRHGLDSFSPKDPAKRTNRVLFHLECADFRHAVDMATKAGDFDANEIERLLKTEKIGAKPYLHHQEG